MQLKTAIGEWIFQWAQDPQTLGQAFALAQKAVALDDSLPRAYLILVRSICGETDSISRPLRRQSEPLPLLLMRLRAPRGWDLF